MDDRLTRALAEADDSIRPSYTADGHHCNDCNQLVEWSDTYKCHLHQNPTKPCATGDRIKQNCIEYIAHHDCLARRARSRSL